MMNANAPVCLIEKNNIILKYTGGANIGQFWTMTRQLYQNIHCTMDIRWFRQIALKKKKSKKKSPIIEHKLHVPLG